MSVDISEEAVEAFIDRLECQKVYKRTAGYLEHVRLSIYGMDQIRDYLRALRSALTAKEAELGRIGKVLSLENFPDAATAIIEYQHVKAELTAAQAQLSGARNAALAEVKAALYSAVIHGSDDAIDVVERLMSSPAPDQSARELDWRELIRFVAWNVRWPGGYYGDVDGIFEQFNAQTKDHPDDPAG